MKRDSVYSERKILQNFGPSKAQSKVSEFFFSFFLTAQGRPSALIVQNLIPLQQRLPVFYFTLMGLVTRQWWNKNE